jgi:hypothetical protein
MLETVCKEIIDKNTFLIHFIDKECNEISSDKSNKIYQYKTGDDSEIKMGLRVNAIPPSVLIDIKIYYPPDFYNPNYYELLDVNEKKFQYYYNEIMNYNHIGYNELVDNEEYHKNEV